MESVSLDMYIRKDSRPHIENLLQCPHQFFEVQDISHSPITVMKLNGKEQRVQGPFRGGKLVMCALCGEQRQLWSNGERYVLIDGQWQKIDNP